MKVKFRISEKTFWYFLFGLFSTNVIGSIIIPAQLGLASSNLSFGYGILGSKFITSHFFAITGIFYRLPWAFVPTRDIPSVDMIFVLLILSIVSIPITLFFSYGIRSSHRVILAYLIHLEILTMFTWWWVPNFGFS